MDPQDDSVIRVLPSRGLHTPRSEQNRNRSGNIRLLLPLDLPEFLSQHQQR